MLLMIDAIAALLRKFLAPKMSEDELAAALDEQVERCGENLDWRHSVVDLLKAVHMDASLQGRARLARELGCQGFTGSAEDNIWLHGEVLRELARHQIRLPNPAP
jgi:hypothetical protein